MIVFDLKCNHDHTFEGWFRSSQDYDAQSDRDMIECPACGSADVTKAIMAPNVASKGNRKTDTTETVSIKPQAVAKSNMIMTEDDSVQTAIAPDLPQELHDQMEELFAKVHKHVEENCTYVGADFAEEARKGHYGESDEKGIYGEASEDETLELLEEGIDVLPLPTRRKSDA